MADIVNHFMQPLPNYPHRASLSHCAMAFGHYPGTPNDLASVLTKNVLSPNS